jgi:hypothetical protein
MFRITSLDGDWDAAFAALAAVEPDGELPLERVLADPAVKPAGELVLVAASLGPRVVDRLLSGGGRRAAIVLVDSASYGRAPASAAPDPGLLRLAAAGTPVAVVRRGDDLTEVLAAGSRGRASA